MVAEPALGGDPGEVLDRQQRAAAGPDQQAERRRRSTRDLELAALDVGVDASPSKPNARRPGRS